MAVGFIKSDQDKIDNAKSEEEVKSILENVKDGAEGVIRSPSKPYHPHRAVISIPVEGEQLI